jgi:hypothetical protein
VVPHPTSEKWEELKPSIIGAANFISVLPTLIAVTDPEPELAFTDEFTD